MMDIARSDPHQRLLAGEHVTFLGTEPVDERRVQASSIKDAALKGMPIKIDNAVIAGAVDFRGVTFAATVRITRTTFEELADLSYVVFQQLVEFDDSIFSAGANFDSARFMTDASLVRAVFYACAGRATSDLIFNDTEFAGVLNASEVKFTDDALVSFTRSRFRNSAYFSRAHFAGTVSFHSAEGEGALQFNEARFRKDFEADYLRVGHYLDLTAARFGPSAPVLLREATIGRSVYCDKARFGSSVEIASSSIASSLVARKAVFRGTLYLANTSISGTAIFEGARFGPRARATFTGASVSGHVDLSQVCFRSAVDFSDFRCGSNVVIHEARCLASVTFARARLDGWLRMTHGRFEEVGLQDLCAEGTVDCTGAIFRGALNGGGAQLGGFSFDGEAFANVSLHGAQLRGLLVLARARFRGRDVALDLAGVAVGRQAFFDEARFYGKLNAIGLNIEQQFSFNKVVCRGDVDFYELSVKRGFFVWQSRFRGAFKLDRANVGGELYLSGARFWRETSFSNSIIHSVRMAANPEWGNRATEFRGKVSFIASRLEYLGFFGVQCTSSSHEVSFAQSVVNGVANFTDARFAGATSFYSSSFGGEVLMQHVRFEEKVDSRGAIFRSNLYVNPATFAAEADFSYARFESGASFRAGFESVATFDMCRFRGLADFSDLDDALVPGGLPDSADLSVGSQFGDVSFRHAEFAGDARFRNITVLGSLNLRDCSFSNLQLPTNPGRLPARIDMRGCAYRRISVDTKSLLRGEGGASRLMPYDRQPYSELERATRALGDDSQANDVYLTWRSAERKAYHREGRLGSWIGSWIYKIIANYGVRPYQLAVVSAALVLAGMLFFQQPGTLRLKELSKDANAQVVPTYSASQGEAFLVALQQFLPFSMPVGEILLPTTRPTKVSAKLGTTQVEFEVMPAVVASALRILGWILVPLGVAGLSGVLRRRPDR